MAQETCEVASEELVAKLGELRTQFAGQSITSRRFENIHNVIAVCAQLLPVLKSFAKQSSLQPIDDVGTVVRFYNETVGFILGERRPIRLQSWAGLIEDVCRDTVAINHRDGNLVARRHWEAPYDRNKVGAPSFGQYQVRRDLLSYADREILEMWLMREHGVDDLLTSIYLLAKVSNTFRQRGLAAPEPAPTA